MSISRGRREGGDRGTGRIDKVLCVPTMEGVNRQVSRTAASKVVRIACGKHENQKAREYEWVPIRLECIHD